MVNRAMISVQAERESDIAAITDIVKQAYVEVPYSNHREHLMIDRLRASTAFIPELSLIARLGGEMAGHVMLTEVQIRNEVTAIRALSLAPLSVLPKFQHRGVGSALVNEAHRRAHLLGYSSIILIGIPAYYRRFGYLPLGLFPITISFQVPESNCMILQLSDSGLAGVSGTVEYPTAWMEQ